MVALSPIVVWFRQDLRVLDNPALAHAAALGAPVIPVYVLDDDTPGPFRLGGASRWWLHGSLTSLASDLKARYGCRLILRRGNAEAAIQALLEDTGARTIVWNRCYEPYAIARDKAIKTRCEALGVQALSFNGSLLAEPWAVKTDVGQPYSVFTPFWRALQKTLAPEPLLPAPIQLVCAGVQFESERLKDWGLLPVKPDWAHGLRESWTPGEHGAAARLESFVELALASYASQRDRPDLEATSRLSAHLHWGEISPRTVYARILAALNLEPSRQKAADKFLSELGWREFSYHLLYHHRDLAVRPFRAAFTDFPWADDEEGFDLWTKGQTGYPIVDAGMRELWQTGWMHNRVRMIVASFLTKDLLIPWKRGADWFWDTLVDADLANNSASWQWVAGCGADAAPYFRVFNPALQSQKFDPDGSYIHRYVPELRNLPAPWIHEPHRAPLSVLTEARIVLGRDYPRPIVDHGQARARALNAFSAIKQPSVSV